jgi:hypothetical protein
MAVKVRVYAFSRLAEGSNVCGTRDNAEAN